MDSLAQSLLDPGTFMRALCLIVSSCIVLTLAGCGGEKVVTMPDVINEKLDAAYDQIKDAGLDDEDQVEVDGGGIFGIVAEGNWTVCKQSPAAGEPVSGQPKLMVKRSCKKKDATQAADDKPGPSATPTKDPTPSPKPKAPDVLTSENNKDLALILTLGDTCADEIDNFAKKYPQQKFRFDGSIADLAAHGGYDTRFDMLIGAGDDGGNTTSGPSFQFYDKNAFQLNLTGDFPDDLAVGQKYTFTAEIEEYLPENCLLRLSPVETKAR